LPGAGFSRGVLDTIGRLLFGRGDGREGSEDDEAARATFKRGDLHEGRMPKKDDDEVTLRWGRRADVRVVSTLYGYGLVATDKNPQRRSMSTSSSRSSTERQSPRPCPALS
jgi:hypothetical protein